MVKSFLSALLSLILTIGYQFPSFSNAFEPQKAEYKYFLPDNQFQKTVIEHAETFTDNPLKYFWWLSFIIPGLGQLLMGEIGQGLLIITFGNLFILNSAVLTGVLITSAIPEVFFSQGVVMAQFNLPYLILLLLVCGLGTGIYLLNIVTAYNKFVDIRKEEDRLNPNKKFNPKDYFKITQDSLLVKVIEF